MNPSLQFDVVAGRSYAIELAGVGSALFTVTIVVQALPTVAITSGATTLGPGQTTQLSATVTCTPNTAVRWTATYGSIDATGNYTAPASLPAGATLLDTIAAISFTDPHASATLSIALQMQL